jgi:hypothetical protein
MHFFAYQVGTDATYVVIFHRFQIKKIKSHESKYTWGSNFTLQW